MIDFYNDQRIKFIDFNAYQLIFFGRFAANG